jgi:hypothetical protein
MASAIVGYALRSRSSRINKKQSDFHLGGSDGINSVLAKIIEMQWLRFCYVRLPAAWKHATGHFLLTSPICAWVPGCLILHAWRGRSAC